VSFSQKHPPELRPPLRKSSKAKAISITSPQQPPSDNLLDASGVASPKYFGMEPVIVEVNRSMERSLNKEPVLDTTGVSDEEEEEEISEALPLRLDKCSDCACLNCLYRFNPDSRVKSINQPRQICRSSLKEKNLKKYGCSIRKLEKFFLTIRLILSAKFNIFLFLLQKMESVYICLFISVPGTVDPN
jgi:hypothetical protein